MVDVIPEFALFKTDFDEVEKLKQTNKSDFKRAYQEKQIDLNDKWFTNGRFIEMLKKIIDPKEGLFNLYRKKGITLETLLYISSFFIGPMQTGDTIPLPGGLNGPPNNNFIFKRCHHKPCTRKNPQHILESIHRGEFHIATISILGHNIRKMVDQLKKPQSRIETSFNPPGKSRLGEGSKKKMAARKIKKTRKTRTIKKKTKKNKAKRAKTQKHRNK
jgi:hypothetical protein